MYVFLFCLWYVCYYGILHVGNCKRVLMCGIGVRCKGESHPDLVAADRRSDAIYAGTVWYTISRPELTMLHIIHVWYDARVCLYMCYALIDMLWSPFFYRN
jgi:hypothetical protein